MLGLEELDCRGLDRALDILQGAGGPATKECVGVDCGFGQPGHRTTAVIPSTDLLLLNNCNGIGYNTKLGVEGR